MSFTRVSNLVCRLLPLLCLCLCTMASGQAIIADHTSTAEFSTIPSAVITDIESSYHIYYVHTSHGSQIVTGINMVEAENSLYAPPYMYERSDDLGHVGDTLWVPHTRWYLDNTPECNMAMFSWCGGCSDNTEAGIDIYLNKMLELEAAYPSVTFIYMTGHLDGGGTGGTVYASNNQIRAFCAANGKILFDFADIESYDPDGTYYPNETDACLWCYDWCAVHTCPTCAYCAHSHCFNCYQKGKAWWWMMARISGWESPSDTIPTVVSTQPSLATMDAPPATTVAATFSIGMDAATLNSSTVHVFGSMTGAHAGAVSYDGPSSTMTFTPDAGFLVGETVTAVITDGVTSSSGTAMDAGYTWSFTCASTGGSGIMAIDSQYFIGQIPKAVATGDFDGNGYPDIAVVGSVGLRILLNDGYGDFIFGETHDVGMWPYGVGCADVNADGDLDILVTMQASEYQEFSLVLIGNGDGTFVTPVSYFGGGEGSICGADLDADGDLDIISTTPFFQSLMLLFNNGDGTYLNDPVELESDDGPIHIAAVDLNNDGAVDLAVGNAYTYHATVFFNDGQGGFGTGQTHITYDHPWGLCAADFDGDGNVDLAGSHESGEYMGDCSIIFNDGSGDFADPVGYYLGAGGAWSVVAADINGDAYADLLTVASDAYLKVLPNNGDGTFSPYLTSATGDYPCDLAAADFDGDDDIDVVTVDRTDSLVSVFFNATAELICGDANADGSTNVGDAVKIINYVFKGGEAPNPVCRGDANGDGATNVGDAVYLINYVFKEGEDPLPGCCR